MPSPLTTTTLALALLATPAVAQQQGADAPAATRDQAGPGERDPGLASQEPTATTRFPDTGIGGVDLADPLRERRAAMPADGRQIVIDGRSLGEVAVRSSDGEELGRVEQVLIDLASGRVTFAVVEVGDKSVAVPWSALRPLEAGEAYAVSATRQQLEAAPAFDADDLPQTAATPVPLPEPRRDR